MTETPPKFPAAKSALRSGYGFGLQADKGEWGPDLSKYPAELREVYEAAQESGTVSPVQVLPLRPEQEAEPLARRRFEELQKLSPEEIRSQLEAARLAKFLNDRQRRRHFERHGESLGISDEAAYEALIAEIQRSPERTFSGYKSKGKQGEVLRWMFTRSDILVVVGVFDNGEVLLTGHRVKLDQLKEGFSPLEDYLRERDDGKRMVEIKL